MADTTTRHDPDDWTPAVTPEGADDWERQEAVREWRNAVRAIDDAVSRLTSIRGALLDVDPAAPVLPSDTRWHNAAGSVAQAAHHAAAYEGVMNGSIHRTAMASVGRCDTVTMGQRCLLIDGHPGGHVSSGHGI